MLAGWLGVEIVLGAVLGIWGIQMGHTYAIVWGLFLTALVVPALRFASYKADPAFRAGQPCCCAPCNCTKLCGVAAVPEGIIVFGLLVLLYVKWTCMSLPAASGTVDAFPAACSGPGGGGD